MNPIFAKLNYKAQPEIVVINAPDAFLPVLNDMRSLATILTDPHPIDPITFAIAFVKTQQEVDAISRALAEKIKGDGVLWMVYPKGSSKKYECDFNRDTGWTVLGESGFETVRMVAIDDDWSALRFRRVDYVKKMTRRSSNVLTEVRKAKSQQEAI